MTIHMMVYNYTAEHRMQMDMSIILNMFFSNLKEYIHSRELKEIILD